MEGRSGSASSPLPGPESSSQAAGSPLSMTAHIGHLPEDVLLEILAWVPCKELILSCRLVCSQWRDLVDLTVLWKRKFEQWKKLCLESSEQASPWLLQPKEDKYIFGHLERNLIRNPCGKEGMDFWEIETPSEGQWEIKAVDEHCLAVLAKDFFQRSAKLAERPSHPVSTCFTTTNGLCAKSQRITLKDHGYWEDLMDTARPTIEVKDWFCSYGHNYQLSVKLLSADNEVIREYSSQKARYLLNRGVWEEVSHTFYDCPPGVRQILFHHEGGGADRPGSEHDAKMTKSSVTVGPCSGRANTCDDSDDDDSYDDSYDGCDYDYDTYASSDEDCPFYITGGYNWY